MFFYSAPDFAVSFYFFSGINEHQQLLTNLHGLLEHYRSAVAALVGSPYDVIAPLLPTGIILGIQCPARISELYQGLDNSVAITRLSNLQLQQIVDWFLNVFAQAITDARQQQEHPQLLQQIWNQLDAIQDGIRGLCRQAHANRNILVDVSAVSGFLNIPQPPTIIVVYGFLYTNAIDGLPFNQLQIVNQWVTATFVPAANGAIQLMHQDNI